MNFTIQLHRALRTIPIRYTRYLQEKAKRKNLDIEEIEKLVKLRECARKDKDFKKADEIREQLQKKGVVIKDTPKGCIWDLE